MNRQLSSLVNYFCLFEGGEANDFKKIKPIAETLAHKDFTIHTGKGTMNREQWLVFIENFSNDGGRVDLLSVKVEPDSSIVYCARLTFADGDVVEAESKATFREGRLYHVEPSDPVKYNKFFNDHVEAAASPIAAGQ